MEEQGACHDWVLGTFLLFRSGEFVRMVHKSDPQVVLIVSRIFQVKYYRMIEKSDLLVPLTIFEKF